MILLKKIGAILSICLFVLMLLGQTTRPNLGGGSAYAIGRLAGLVIALGGLYYSTRWLLILNGRKHKVGRQAFAILWCAESLLGVLAGLGAVAFVPGRGSRIGLVMVVVWSVSLWLTYRWLSKIRQEEMVVIGKTW
jgi:hypothetical protein